MTFNAHPINKDYTVSAVDDGTILILGNTSITDSSGAIRVTFYPSVDFVGSFGVMSRPSGDVAYNRQTGFLQCPYRLIYANGQAYKYELANDALSGAFDIQIPANASSVGLMIACTQGTGYLYWQPVTRGSDVVAAIDGSPIGATVVSVTAQFSRPADTTAYTAGDVVSNSTTKTTLMAFPGLSLAGRSATIVNALLETDNNAFPSAMTATFYTSPSVSVAVDNAAATTLWVNAPYYAGALTFNALAGGTGTNTALVIASANLGITFQPFGSDTALYALLTDGTGSTPTSGQNFRMTLTAVQN